MSDGQSRDREGAAARSLTVAALTTGLIEASYRTLLAGLRLRE